MKKTVLSLAPACAVLCASLCASLFASSPAWPQQVITQADADGRTEHVDATAAQVHACREQAAQQQLEGSNRARYMGACITLAAQKNSQARDFDGGTAVTPQPAAPHADAEGRGDEYAGTTRATRLECIDQAARKQLEGEARRQFMRECAATPPAVAQPATPEKTTVLDAEGRPVVNTGETSKQAAQCRQQARSQNLSGSALAGFLERCQHEAQNGNSAS